MLITNRTPHPAPLAVAQARRIVGNPNPDHSDDLRRVAWEVAKSAQGNPVRQHRLHPGFDPNGAA